LPLVTDETRVAWEEYALINRSQIDEAFLEDLKRREKQDEEFGLTNTSSTGIRMLQPSQQESILDDGTEYYPRIWSNGGIGPARDEPEEKVHIYRFGKAGGIKHRSFVFETIVGFALI
jgi:hypothetical protein